MKHLVLVHGGQEPSIHGRLAAHYAERLRNRGHDVELTGPELDELRLTRDEYAASKEGRPPADVARAQAALLAADALTLVFPLWWVGLPAELKGWVDRVLAYGFAYELEGETPVPLLAPRRAATIVTTGTPDDVYAADGTHRALAHVWNEHLYRFVGLDPVGTVFCGNAVLANDGGRRVHEARVEALADAFDGATPGDPPLWPDAGSGNR